MNCRELGCERPAIAPPITNDPTRDRELDGLCGGHLFKAQHDRFREWFPGDHRAWRVALGMTPEEEP